MTRWHGAKALDGKIGIEGDIHEWKENELVSGTDADAEYLQFEASEEDPEILFAYSRYAGNETATDIEDGYVFTEHDGYVFQTRYEVEDCSYAAARRVAVKALKQAIVKYDAEAYNEIDSCGVYCFPYKFDGERFILFYASSSIGPTNVYYIYNEPVIIELVQE